MSRRSRKYRKQFDCGHRGFGRYCHRCAEVERLRHLKQAARLEVRTSRQRNKQDWEQSFEQDELDLRHLPRRVVVRARQALAKLVEGVALSVVRGKRMKGDRTVVSVPLGYRYRLLCRKDKDGVVPIRAMSHESYNRVVNGRLKV